MGPQFKLLFLIALLVVILAGCKDEVGPSDCLDFSDEEFVYPSSVEITSGRAIAVDEDGAIYVAGNRDYPYARTIIAKLNSNFDTIYTVEFDEIETIVSDLMITSDNELIAVGFRRTNGYDVWAVKLSSSGQQIWMRSIELMHFSIAHSVIQASDGNIVLAGSGQKLASDPLDRDPFLIKLDNANGNTIFVSNPSTPYNDRDMTVHEKPDGTYTCIGVANPLLITGTMSVYMYDYSAQGQMDTSRAIAPYDGQITVLPSLMTPEGFLIASAIRETPVQGVIADVEFRHVDQNGNSLWITDIELPMGADRVFAMIPTSDGGTIAVGETHSFAAADILAIRLDADGHVLWKNAYGAELSDQANDIADLGDGTYIITGYSGYGNTDTNVILLRIDADGRPIEP